KILNGAAFLKQFAAVQNRFPKLADAAAACGLGSVGIKLASVVSERRATSRGYLSEPFDHFSEWAGQIWGSSRRYYNALAVRNPSVMNSLFAGRRDMTCLRIWKTTCGAGCQPARRSPIGALALFTRTNRADRESARRLPTGPTGADSPV